MKLLSYIRESFSLDYRSLALYRFFMGLIVIADVLYRVPDIENFYTDIGLIPRSIFINEMSMPWSLSFHLANGSTLFASCMFLIQLIFGLMLVIGFKTRWAMIGAYLMAVSVHNRNWLVNNGGDDIMRAVLFISIFLPLDKYFSIDSALRRDKKNHHESHFSFWGLSFFIQVFLIYFVSYILKTSPIWRSDYTAAFYSSRLDIFANSFGVWMRDFPLVLKFMTWFTIYLEFIGPLLLLFSFVFGRYSWVARTLIIVLFWGLHLGIISTMLIGVFPYLCLVMWMIFIPTPLWNKLMSWIRGSHQDMMTIYFDGDCRFCEKASLILREFFLLPEVRVLPAQVGTEIQREMYEKGSWVITNQKGEMFFHFSGMIELMKHSPILKWIIPFVSRGIVFRFFNRVYFWISHHRQLMSSFSQFLEFNTDKTSHAIFRGVHQLSGAFILLTLIMWNLTTIKKYDIKAPFFQNVTRWIHLYQEWNMFAPFPKMDNIWVEVPAVLSDGSEIELLSGDRDIYSMKDRVFPKLIPNEHWRKFYLNLSERTDYARYYGGYLCRTWNERHIRKVENLLLTKFEVVVYTQPNLPDGSRGGVSRKLSWKHWCFDEDYKKEKH